MAGQVTILKNRFTDKLCVDVSLITSKASRTGPDPTLDRSVPVRRKCSTSTEVYVYSLRWFTSI